MFDPRRRRRGDRALIYLIGPAGHPNFGDEFIARTWLRHLASVRPDARVVLDCHTPGQASILLHGAHPDVTFVDTVWRLTAGLEDQSFVTAVDFAERVVRQPGILPLLVDGIELLRSARSIHLIGGGYLNSLWRRHLSILAAAVTVRRDHGCPVYLTGQGLLPTGDAEHIAMLRSLVSQTSRVDVRDRESGDLIGDAAASRTVTGDDAWLGITRPGVYSTGSIATDRTYIVCAQTHLMDPGTGVDVNSTDPSVVDRLEREVASLAEAWGMTAANTCFVEAMPGDDGVLHRRFAATMPGLPLIPFTELWRHGFPARPEQVWITTRFHAHLVAAARGASGVVITGRSDYYPIKHRSLLDQGSRWEVHPLSDGANGVEVPERPPSSGGFAPDVARELTAGKRTLADALYPPR
ncbi:polysaccharide pyruvyl transferase family protein [Williamsia sp. MIQD14]|uniref:polysaccharide pyruvyl transferase family protein n=1 Tax=Williamsia sp. MIQD14 TaxID=3425703 RepID=UPI003DA0406D